MSTPIEAAELKRLEAARAKLEQHLAAAREALAEAIVELEAALAEAPAELEHSGEVTYARAELAEGTGKTGLA